MAWNWTFSDWPNFQYDRDALAQLEQQFLLVSGEVLGAVRHIGEEDQKLLRIELLGEEALKTSQIEGEVLDRVSVQSSLRRQFGLAADVDHKRPQEQGIAEMMVDAYSGYADPLDHASLCRWHSMLMKGNRNLETIGAYRTHGDAMQIVSGTLDKQKIHFEAPPSDAVPAQMEAFIDWFNQSSASGASPLPALTRAGIGHLYFESIHPFEDGNGRLGRALAEKSLAQNIGYPSLIAISYAIERKRRSYYDQLEKHQQTLLITDWLVYFANTVLEAQQATLSRIAFHIAKTRFYDSFRDQLNERQTKAVARMFREGLDGFKGGLSAENYIAITGASRATTTRDLHELVSMGALTRTGVRRHTRYNLNLPIETSQ